MNTRNLFVRFLGSLLLLATLGACQEKIELDLPEGEKFLVVEGWITNEAGPHRVLLTQTSPYFDTSPQPVVSGAVVRLEDDHELSVQLDEVEPGVYVYPDSGTVGRSYRLDIVLPDGEHYRSDFSLLQAPVPILDISYRLSDDEPDPDENPDDVYFVGIDTQDPAGIGDCYRWRTVLNGTPLTDPLDMSLDTDELIDGSYLTDIDFSRRLFAWGDTVTVIQDRIARPAYDFLFSIRFQAAFVGTPFDTPPAPVQGNVKNLTRPDHPARGYFGAAGRARATVVVGE